MSDSHPITRKEKALFGLKRFAAIFLYLWGLLAVFALHKSLVLSESGVHYRQGFAAVNALVLAKIMFIAEEMRVGERYERAPLVYAAVFKASVYSIVLTAFESLEGLVLGYFRGKDLAASLSEVGGGTPFGILTTALVAFFALLPFFAFRELGQAIGEPELHRLLFDKRTRLKITDES